MSSEEDDFELKKIDDLDEINDKPPKKKRKLNNSKYNEKKKK